MREARTDAAVVAEGLVKRYGPIVAVDGIDLVVPAGSVLGLLGPNGAGKTTTVRMLATLLAPDAGHATVGGFDVARQPNEVRKVIGLTGQYAAVDEELTGRENLVLVGRLSGFEKARAFTRAAELLERFELAAAADRVAKTYSGGMRRRLDLAASLVGEPVVLFLDEPTTGLDPRSRLALWDVIGDLRSGGTTVVLTTQYLEEADRLADRIVVVDDGHVIAEGTADELKRRVGGDVLSVTIADRDRSEAAAAALESSGVGAGEPQVDSETGVLSVPVAGGAASLVEAVRALDNAGVAIDDISLHRPSLDDVFLALTGHAAEDDARGAP